MKTLVHLPYGYGRTISNRNRFVRSAPEFNISIFDDAGNKVQDAYPSTVRMGPEMYEFIKRIVPRLAARLGEDNVFEGKVDNRPRRPPTDKYAYYSIGPNGPELVGYGASGTPTGYGKGVTLRDGLRKLTNLENNMGELYAKKLGSPSPTGSESRSNVLTKILNDSLDFSPLFGPVYDFRDPDYDSANDPEGKGPRPTDNWVPRVDKETGQLMRDPETGRLMFMPVPVVQSLPIYNFMHPAWKSDPNAAWNMITDPKSALDWAKWGKAPSYANFRGEKAATKKGKIYDIDYKLENMERASTPGYFTDEFPDKESALHAFNEYKNLLDQARRKDAIQQTLEDEKANADLQGFLSRSIANEAGEMKGQSKGELRNRFRGVLNKMFKDPGFADRLAMVGVTPEDKIPMLDLATSEPSKYGQYADDKMKALAILEAYGKQKRASGGKDVGGIAEAMMGPGQ